MAKRHARRDADALTTDRRTRHEVLVHLPVTVAVDAITDRVIIRGLLTTRNAVGTTSVVDLAVAVVVDIISAELSSCRLSRHAIIHDMSGQAGDRPRCLAPAHTAGALLDAEVLIHAPITIGIHPVAAGVLGLGGSPRNAFLHLHAIDTCTDAARDTRAGTAAHGRSDEVLVHSAIAVVVDSIADAVVLRGLTRDAAIEQLARVAGHKPLGSTRTHTAADRARREILVHGAVAVVIHSIAAHVFVRGRRQRLADIELNPVGAARAPRVHARAHAATRGARREVLVDGPITIVVDPIAGCVIRRRILRLTGIRQDPFHAKRVAAVPTSSLTARGREWNEALIDGAITIVVDPITVRVVPERIAGLAGVEDRASRADGLTRRRAGTRPTAGRVGHEVLVVQSITVLIDAVARRIVCCAPGHLAGVDDLRVDAADEALTRAESGAAGAHGHDKILVGASIAIVIDAITCRVFKGASIGAAHILLDAVVACRRPGGHARARAARADSGDERLIDLPITIIVLAITVGVRLWILRHARVVELTPHTEHVARLGAGPGTA